MPTYTIHYEMADRIQSYFTPDAASWMAVYADEMLIGIFTSSEDAYAEYSKQTCSHAVALFTKLINPTTVDPNYKKEEHSRVIRALMTEHEKAIVGTIGWIEVLFLYLMMNPTFLASEPKFREGIEDKVKLFTEQLNGKYSTQYHRSKIILNLMPQFLEDVKKHPRYTELPVVVPPKTKTNPYNTRPHKYINYALFNHSGERHY